MISIEGLMALLDGLDRLDIAAAQHEVLDRAANGIASSVQKALSHLPGEDHSAPWLRTGTLHASIAITTDDLMAVIGSNDPVAADQELGTKTIPPRPFLAPVAAVESEDAADAVGSAVANAISGAVR